MNVTKELIYVTENPRYAATEKEPITANVDLVTVACLNISVEVCHYVKVSVFVSASPSASASVSVAFFT